jgi:hypothetical protein
MLLDVAPGDENKGDMAYCKLYLMIVNIVKSVMLLVGALGPNTIWTTVITSTVASFLLGSVTMTWFQTAPETDKLQVCCD